MRRDKTQAWYQLEARNRKWWWCWLFQGMEWMLSWGQWYKNLHLFNFAPLACNQRRIVLALALWTQDQAALLLLLLQPLCSPNRRTYCDRSGKVQWVHRFHWSWSCNQSRMNFWDTFAFLCIPKTHRGDLLFDLPNPRNCSIWTWCHCNAPRWACRRHRNI